MREKWQREGDDTANRKTYVEDDELPNHELINPGHAAIPGDFTIFERDQDLVALDADNLDTENNDSHHTILHNGGGNKKVLEGSGNDCESSNGGLHSIILNDKLLTLPANAYDEPDESSGPTIITDKGQELMS